MKTTRIIFSALVFIALALSFAAAGPEQPAAQEKAKKLWTTDDILLAESASDWDVSPDGRRAVWVKSHLDKDKNSRVSNLFLTDLETKKEFQLTQGSENHSQPAWSPDGQTIAFLSKRPLPKAKAEIKDEEKEAGPQMWLMSLPGASPIRSPNPFETLAASNGWMKGPLSLALKKTQRFLRRKERRSRTTPKRWTT